MSQYYRQQRLATRVEAAEIAAVNRQLQQEVKQLAADGALAHWRAEAESLGALEVPFERSGAGREDEAGELRPLSQSAMESAETGLGDSASE